MTEDEAIGHPAMLMEEDQVSQVLGETQGD
jgi:hypothetical protein